MILLSQKFTKTKTQKEKKTCVSSPAVPPLHIPLMHHLTSACTAAAAAAYAMQVAVPVCGVCVHAQQRCNLDRMEWILQRAR
jgi:hypothetical protein